MTDTDTRFERDLRETLEEQAPDDVPAGLRDAVAGVPYRAAGRRLPFGWTGRTYAALAAVATVAVLTVGVGTGLLRLPGAGPDVGGPSAPGSPAASGELRIEYQAMPVNGQAPTEADVAAVAAVIAKRLDATGIVAPSVTTAPSGRIIVELAVDPTDATTTTRLRQLVGTTGRIDVVPLGSTPVEEGQPVDLAAFPPLFSGDQVASARIGSDQTNQRAIDLTLRPEAASLFAAYTRDHIGEYFAIVLDGSAVSVPVIQSAIEGGEVQISSGGLGGFAAVDAQALVALIGSGPLPFPLQEVANSVTPAATPVVTALSIANGTSIPVTLIINGNRVETVAAGATHDPISAKLPAKPWTIETWSPSGRVLSTLTVSADAIISDTAGRAVRVDLSCGRLDVWTGPPLLGPTFVPGPSGDCD